MGQEHDVGRSTIGIGLALEGDGKRETGKVETAEGKRQTGNENEELEVAGLVHKVVTIVCK